MERYSSYKDSGVEWLVEIPGHWEVVRIKHTASNEPNSFMDGDWIESKDLATDGIRYLTTGNVGALAYKEQGEGFISETTFKKLNCSEVFPGDLLISRLNEPIGRTCIVPDLGYRIVVAVDNVIYRPCDKFDRQYLVYQMNCAQYAEYANLLARGTTMSRISRTQLGKIKILCPPLSEQRAMSAYLDRATAQLDAAIAREQQMIDLLNERKRIIIQQAVTKGLAPNAKLKPSGVEWIGDVPEGWEQIPLKYVFEMRNGYTPSKNNLSYWTNGTIPWYRMEDIRQKGRFLNEANQYVTRQAVNGKGVFKAGSFIMAICTASIGEHAMLIADSLANQRFANFKICKSLSDKYLPMFLFYYMFVVGDFCRNNANSTCFQYVDMAALKHFPIPMPSMEEQTSIVEYLEESLANIEKCLNQREKQKALLQERKQILISEVVTGKIKVS